jgi:hypothetical protein
VTGAEGKEFERWAWFAFKLDVKTERLSERLIVKFIERGLRKLLHAKV